jgi:integrase
MARKVSFSPLESRSARLRLKTCRKPYTGPTLARGISLMYRRNKTNGTWVVKASNGHGAYWTKGFGLADDFEDSDGKNVLTFYQAQDTAKRLARGDADSDAAPLSVDAALNDYKRDLEARVANPYNAEWPRQHLPKALIAKPVQLLTATELKKWRDSLLDKLAPATINRLCRCLGAALELCAKHDHERIKNRAAWEIGLACLPGAQEQRNVILSDDEVRAFVANAYMVDDGFGLIIDVLAVTGARPSQVVRLRVDDLQDHPVRPKLMMPKSGKGGGRNRSAKKLERYSVPITVQLATRLRAAAKGRDLRAPLLLHSDGRVWDKNPGQQYHHLVAKVVAAIGLNPAEVTAYALRHSSIVRALLLNVPIRVVASSHNTSVRMIEANYSKFITEHSDEISRAALLHHPIADNVVPLTR